MRIAVAHRDEEVRRLIISSLRQDGHCVVSLSSAEELVSCLSSWTLRGTRPDLLVLGDDLGSRSGAEVAAGVRDTAWDAPVVLVIDATTPDSRGDAGAADAVFTTPFDTDDLRTVALCLAHRTDGETERQGAERPTLPDPVGLRVELAFRGIPFLDELVYFARNRAARLEAATGIRGRCSVRIHSRWRRGCRVYVTEMELAVPGSQPMRLVRSDLDLFTVIGCAFDAVERVLSARQQEHDGEQHDGWQPIRKREPPLSVSRAERWGEDTTEQLVVD